MTKQAGVVAVLAVLFVAYVLPGHVSAGRNALLHVVIHIGFFAACGLSLAWAFGGRRLPLLALLVLAFVLEWAQWRIIGFAHLEWGDVASNEAGVLVALGVVQGWRAVMNWRGRG